MSVRRLSTQLLCGDLRQESTKCYCSQIQALRIEKYLWTKALRKYENQPFRKSNPAVGTNPVQHDCSQRNDKFVAELNRLKLSSELTCTGFVKTKIGPYIPLSPKKYASIWLKFRMKAPGAPEEKLSALEAFVPPTHFLEWVGEPD